MKIQSDVLKYFGLFSLLLMVACGCDKNEEIEPIPDREIEIEAGVAAEDLENYQGDIGILISAREVAKFGYQPAKMEVSLEADNYQYSEMLTLNELTLMTQIKLSLEELSTAAADELSNGVPVSVKLFDRDDQLIKKEVFTNRSFQTTPSTLVIDTDDLPDLHTEVNLKPGTPYYMQLVDEDGNPTEQSLKLVDVPYPGKDNTLMIGKKHDFDGDEKMSIFEFRPLDAVKNGFVIYNRKVNKVLEHLNLPHNLKFVSANTHRNRFFDWTENQILRYSTLYFVIEKEKEGIYILKAGKDRGPVLKSGLGLTGSDQWSSYKEEAIVRFRLIAMDVMWDFETIETQYMEPMLPKAQTSFGFNNTLINCGNGSLVQDVGSSVSETITVTTGWEESVSVSTTHSSEVTVSIGMEVSGSFFGNGAKYSADISGTLATSSTAMQSNTRWNDIQETAEETFFVSRQVTVPPKSASLVVDAIQTYNNVKIHFVQRLRIRAKDAESGASNLDLSGKEIQSLFAFSGFNGVITKVGSDYVEVTVKGTTTLGKWIDTKSEVQAVEPKCG